MKNMAGGTARWPWSSERKHKTRRDATRRDLRLHRDHSFRYGHNITAFPRHILSCIMAGTKRKCDDISDAQQVFEEIKGALSSVGPIP